MRKLKKAILSMLCIGVLLGVTACGANNGNNSVTDPQNNGSGVNKGTDTNNGNNVNDGTTTGNNGTGVEDGTGVDNNNNIDNGNGVLDDVGDAIDNGVDDLTDNNGNQNTKNR